jgi:protoporphyrin/coproporphyrin ferrochelatase
MNKKGVLLVNLGTPDAPNRQAVYRYLKEFLLDYRVIDYPAIKRNLLVRGLIAPFRSKSAAKLYQELWTDEGSPLKVYGLKLKELLQKEMGDEYFVDLAMRYQNPSMESVIQNMLENHVTEITIVPLFPHYASASTGSVYEESMRILSKELAIPKLKFINAFYEHPGFIDAFAERAAEHDIESYDHVILSYHGLPVSQLIKADRCNHCSNSPDCCDTISFKNQHCYSAQCQATTRALVKSLNLKEGKYTSCFQSRLTKEPWREPYTTDIIKKRAEAGDKKLLFLCPSFIADCLETTIEVSVEYAELFEELGGEKVQLVESLNTLPTWVKELKNIILA